jgi:hypothetical protein
VQLDGDELRVVAAPWLIDRAQPPAYRERVTPTRPVDVGHQTAGIASVEDPRGVRVAPAGTPRCKALRSEHDRSRRTRRQRVGDTSVPRGRGNRDEGQKATRGYASRAPRACSHKGDPIRLQAAVASVKLDLVSSCCRLWCIRSSAAAVLVGLLALAMFFFFGSASAAPLFPTPLERAFASGSFRKPG